MNIIIKFIDYFKIQNYNKKKKKKPCIIYKISIKYFSFAYVTCKILHLFIYFLYCLKRIIIINETNYI